MPELNYISPELGAKVVGERVHVRGGHVNAVKHERGHVLAQVERAVNLHLLVLRQ